MIRLANEQDTAAILQIYAPYVRETVVSFELEPPSMEDMRNRILKALWLVCENHQGEVMGYAYASQLRERPAYQWSVETTVYVDKRFQRMGIGRGLYETLFALLRLRGFYNAFAGITLPNDASVGLHQSVGFQAVGVYHHVGFKLEQWHDVSWWFLVLQPATQPPRAILPVDALKSTSEWQTAFKTGLAFLRIP